MYQYCEYVANAPETIDRALTPKHTCAQPVDIRFMGSLWQLIGSKKGFS